MKRRFELIEGTSSKFWEVETTDSDMTVCFGRIGTSGQSKTKSFADAASASAEAAKLIKEKTGKGYSEVSASASATPTPAQAKSSPPAKAVSATTAASPKPTLATSTAPAPAPEPPSQVPAVSATVTSLTLGRPNGGYAWTPDDWLLLPTFRGIKAKPFEPELSLLGDWADQVAKRINNGRAKQSLDWLAQFGHLQRLQKHAKEMLAVGRVWSELDAKRCLARDTLKKKDLPAWREIVEQSFFALSNRYAQGAHRRAMNVCLALHGPTFLLDVVASLPELFEVEANGVFHQQEFNALGFLRRAIAISSEAEHEAVMDVAVRHFGRDEWLDVLLSNVIPHHEAFAEQALLCKDQQLKQLLKHSALTLASACQFVKSGHMQMWSYQDAHKPTVLLWIKRFGAEGALQALAPVLDRNDLGLRKAMAKMLVGLRTETTLEQLIPYILDKEVRPSLEPLAIEFPAEALRAAFERAAATRSKDLESWAVRFATNHMPALGAALEALSPAVRARAENLIQATQREAAPDEELPAVLRAPPWAQKIRPQSVPLSTLVPIPIDAKLDWSEGEQARAGEKFQSPWTLQRFDQRWNSQFKGKPAPTPEQRQQALQEFVLDELRIRQAAHARVLAGGALEPNDLLDQGYVSPEPLSLLEPALALRLWNSIPAKHWSTWSIERVVQGVLAKLGVEALPGLVNLVQLRPLQTLHLIHPVAAVELVPMVARACKMKRVRGHAFAWLRRHAALASVGLLEAALGLQHKDKALRDAAQFAVRWMVANELGDALLQAARRYGSDCEAALGALLAIDPLSMVPNKMPNLPAWFAPGAYERPVLNDGRSISVAASAHIGTMLMISDIENPYGGLDIVRECCTAASLAEFAWNIFQSWSAAGFPSKDNWGFMALGLLGNDESARRLAPLIREWPGQAAHARAVTGLELLSAIGSDVALMHLNSIADKAKFKGLQERARERIQQIAEQRGLTRDELADRLVPDLGLDEAGALQLDFGTRVFKVAFDEALKPYVMDAAGTRLKDLPKPIKSDDATLAEIATARYKAIKKDAKAIASQQIRRLEHAMVNARRWPVADFRLFFIEHPLMRFLSQRLAWGVYDDQGLEQLFRVAEDLSFANPNDQHYELPGDANVGIAHVLDCSPEVIRALGEVFADYNILQPFKQLSRETYVLSEAERTGSVLTRFADRRIATVSLMGLIGRGWERSGAEDGGWVGQYCKRISSDLEAQLDMEPGTVIGDPTYEPVQKVPAITLRRSGTWGNEGLVPYRELSATQASELLRDIDLLALVT